MRVLNMVQAINEALDLALSRDERVLVFGEDVGRLGGVFRVTEGLQAKYGEKRVFDTPLAESGILALAIGLAMGGMRPVAEIQFAGFLYPALDQILSHLGRWRHTAPGGGWGFPWWCGPLTAGASTPRSSTPTPPRPSSATPRRSRW